MMKTVVTTCPFVPQEWIAAHGLRPSRILPGPADASRFDGVPAGLCPYANAFTHAARAAEADAVIFTTTCDQMRRAHELIARERRTLCFLMNVPTTWQSVTAVKMYAAELKRLSRFLLALGGAEPSPEELARVMTEYDAKRRRLREARPHLSPRAYSEAIAHFHQTGALDLHTATPNPQSAVRNPQSAIALVGGPLTRRHFNIFDHVERTGGTIVLDATTSGERTLPAPFNRRALRENPFMALVDAYFGAIPDAFRRPNSLLYQWLKAEIEHRGIRGIIFRHYTWCDTWHAEAQRMKEWAPVPLLALATDADGPIDGHALNRIESFVEMVR